MRSRGNLDWFRVILGKNHAGRRIGWNHDHYLDLLLLNRPRGLGQTIVSDVSYAGVSETTSRMWPYGKVAITRCSGCKTTYGTVQPIGNSPKGIVVEGCHLIRIDRAIWTQAVPALPDGCGTHGHRIEP